MPEDKLTRAERIRLEALSQSVNVSALVTPVRPTMEVILKNAEHIEAWLRKARDDA